MNHVCTHVLHLDLVHIDQNMSATARLIVMCDPVKKFKSFNASSITHTFWEMCPVSTMVK